MRPEYESTVEEAYRRALKPGDICIDVGAHLGRHTLPMARAVKTTGEVHAFEPLDACRTELSKRMLAQVAIDPMAQIFLYGVALGDVPGEAEFVVVDSLPEYSGLRERNYDSPVTTHRIAVKVERLDDLQIRHPIRFVKVDAEGAEFLILRGSKGILRRDRPVVAFECGDSSMTNCEHSSREIYDFFIDLQHHVRDICGNYLFRVEFVESNKRESGWDDLAEPR